MARAEHVWLCGRESAGMPTESPEPVIQRITSLPFGLSWESFTLPVWIITRLRADCPCMNKSSFRAKVRALAQEAISMHSLFDRPAKRAEAHIIATRSARLELVVKRLEFVVNTPPGA